MCVDFTNVNKACPKNSYLLPKIDKLLDARGVEKNPTENRIEKPQQPN